MKPQKKAQELVQWGLTHGASKEVAKLFALKIVIEIIQNTYCIHKTKYWQEVKQEIEKL